MASLVKTDKSSEGSTDTLDGLVGTLITQLKTNPPDWLKESVIKKGEQSNTKYRFIIAPGNGGCGANIKAVNWYGWFDQEMKKRGHESICTNWPDPYICHQSQWIPHCLNELKLDENTVIVGHSTGALLAMRLIEKYKVAGIILVSAAHTDLGDAGERASGYFDEDWDWEAMKPNAQFIHQFHSDDDHLIPVTEARFVASKLKGDNYTYEELSGYGHFFEPFQPLLDAVDKYCQPVQFPEVQSQ
jgi:predicted alpha/beta hydrolase family esterase